MNGNMCNNSSYCRRHAYVTRNKSQSRHLGVSFKDSYDNSHDFLKCNNAKVVTNNNILKKTYNKLTLLVSDKQSFNQMIDKAADWLEVDDKSLRVEGVKKKIPVKLISSVIVIAISLMLIVSGAVISSKANMELYASENKLAELRERESDIDEALELKNDLVYIEDIARNKLGMIDREYGTVMYIDMNNNDRIEIYEKSTDTSAFHALLNALGFFEE